MIIAAYAGTGKTYLASLCPDKVIDLVCMPYKYHLENKFAFDESSKANFDNILNENWPYNYILAIKDCLNSNKIILIPTDVLILSILKSKQINYTLCYPQKDAKDIYYNRFINRGNNEEFINIFIGNWDNYMEIFERDAFGKHIVLQSNQFLSDVLWV